MYDLRDIMQGAWNVARFQALKSGKPARAHFSEALKSAWHFARVHAENARAPQATEYTSMGYRAVVSYVPAAFVAEVVAAMGARVTEVGARSVTVTGNRDTGFAMSPYVNRVRAMYVAGVQAGMAEKVSYATKADLRRQAEAEAKAAAAARAAAPKWQERIVVGVSDTNSDAAPTTIERDGRTLSLTGYGKVWSHYDSSDCSVYGVHPSYDRVRYAYYA